MTPAERAFLMSSNYPAELEVRSSEGLAARYRLAPEFYADSSGERTPAANRLVAQLDENIAVLEGATPPGEAAQKRALPVYRAQPSGAFAVPTGRVWVRFADGVKAAEKNDAFKNLGFEIEESPAWAPQAVWLRSSSGRIADALAALPELKGLTEVVQVEPQMLTAIARK